jgi:ABC-type branched-subunit amino acid transport system substrate-binding protein
MRRAFFTLVCALAAAGAAEPATAGALTAQEQAGREIYLQGTSPSGARISARIGTVGAELSGQAIACGNCHGEDGRGRAEGGVRPSSIRWSDLVKPYGHDHDGWRRHGPFDERHLERAVMLGLDPAGNRLESAMPRYALSAKDFASLVAYLKQLEFQLDPGVSDDSLRIGTLLPQTGRLGGLGESVHALLAAYFAQINGRGGIHGRRLELVVQTLPDEAAEGAAHARALMSDAKVFTVLAPVAVGIDKDLAEAAQALQVPVVGPLTLFAEDRPSHNPYVFHLLPGSDDLARLLAHHAAREQKPAERAIALWHAHSDDGREHAREFEAGLRQTGWRTVVALPIPQRGASHETLAATMKSLQLGSVLVLSPGADLGALAAALARAHWTPRLLVAGPLASRDVLGLPPAFADRVTLAYPTAPGHQQEAALRDLARLVQGRPDARAYQTALVSAYAAAQLLVEGLKRSGRDLSRSRLLATLEGVQGFDTGLLPRLSYNADRRIGAAGAYLVAVDLESKGLRPLGAWQALP